MPLGWLQDIAGVLQGATNPNAYADTRATQAAQDQGFTGTTQQLGSVLAGAQNPQDAISKLAQIGTPEAVAMAQKYQAQLPAFNPLSPKDILNAQTELYKANPLTQDAPNLAALGGAQQPQQPAALGQVAQAAQQAPATPQIDPRTLSGDDYLGYIGNKMGPGFANQVKAISEGRQAPPPPGSRATQAALLNQAVAQYKPDFDFANAAENFKNRQATEAEFTKGQAAGNVRSIGTASDHLATLVSQIPQVSNSNYPIVNGVKNWVSQETGDSGITKFNQTSDALAGELGAVYKGAGHNSDNEIATMRGALNPNASPEQKYGAAENALNLMTGRAEELAQQYNRGKSLNPGDAEYKQPDDFLSPQAKANIATAKQAIFNFKSTGQVGGAAAQPTQTVAPAHLQGLSALPQGYKDLGNGKVMDANGQTYTIRQR